MTKYYTHFFAFFLSFFSNEVRGGWAGEGRVMKLKMRIYVYTR